MLKKNRKSIIKKLALMVFIMLGLTIGSTFVAAHDTVVDPGYDKNVIGNNITDVTGNAWATISIVVMTLAIGCIVVTGLRYMLSSSDRKADIKQSSAYIVIGCILIFATMPIINIVTNTFKETVGAHIVYDSTKDSYKGNGSIEKATITSTTVGRNHFQNAASLKTVVFEEGVEFIQGGAFKNCKNLEEIILPSTIKSIGPSAFEGCVNVKRIIIRSKDKDEAKIIDGVKYNVVGVIVGEKAFKGCEKAAKFGVGNHIYFASIGDSAFDGCKKLQGFYKLNATNDLEITADNEVLKFSGELAASGSNDIVSKIGLNAFNQTDLSILKVSTVNSFGEKNNIIGSSETIKNKTLLQINKVMDDKDITEISVENHSKIEFLNGSFKDFKKLTKINIGTDCDINFGISAFENCSKLQTVAIGDRAKPVTFGEKSFKGAGDGTMTVTLGNGTGADTITFGKEAFGLSNMSALDIGQSYAVNIGESAFAGSGVVTVGIGINSKGVTFGKTSFSDCTKLGMLVIGEKASNVTFDESSFARAGTGGFTVTVNSAAVSEEGANKLIDIGKNAFTGAFIQKLTIKDNYTVSVGNLAFAGTGIQTVEIGNNSSAIRFYESAFESCFSLNKLAIGDNILDKVTFGENSFKNAGTDLNVTIGESSGEKAEDTIKFMGSAFEESGVLDFTVGKSHRVSIGENAFKSANLLEKFVVPITINADTKAEDYSIVSKIGESAFMGCTALQEFGTINNTIYLDLEEIEGISNSAFNACANLKSIRIYAPEKIINIGDMAFYGCSNMNGAYLLAYDAKLGNIGASAFKEGKFVGKLVLYGNSIGDEAFLNTGVSSVEFKAVDVRCSIGSQAFQNTSIATLTPGAGMSFDIRSKAFFGCTNLNGVEIIFEGIGESAFRGCSNLVNVTLAASGKDNRTISKTAFQNAFKPTGTLKLTGNITVLENAFDSANMKNFTFEFQGQSEISNAAFINCKKLKEVNITETENEDKEYKLDIGSNVFSGAFAIGSMLTLEGNINIGQDAFARYRYSLNSKLYDFASASVESVEFTVTGQNKIDPSAFWGCNQLSSVKISTTGDNAKLDIGSNAFSGAFTTAGRLELDGNINISSSAFTASKKALSNYVDIEAPAANLESITFKSTGTNTIGNNSFDGCINLENVEIATSGSGTVSINSNAFKNAFKSSENTTLTLNGKISLGNKSFYNTNVKTVTATTLGSSIGNQAFDGSSNLTTVTLNMPNNVGAIGNKAFYNCKNLSNFFISNSTTVHIPTIGESAFAMPEGASSVALNFNGASCKTISKNAFAGRNLGKITIVAITDGTTIDDSAFANASNGTLTFTSGKVIVNGNAFKNSNIDVVAIKTKDINVYMNSFANASIATVNLGANNEGTVTIQQNAFLYSTVGNLIIDAETIDIKANGFSNLTKIDKVNLKNASVTVYANSFDGANIDYIVVGSNATFTDFVADTFKNCKLKGFINEYEKPTYIKCNKIESGAFSGAVNMTALYVSSINANDTVKIGDISQFYKEDKDAKSFNTIFGGASSSLTSNNITKIKFKGNVEIGAGAFAYLPKVTSVEFESPNTTRIYEINVYPHAFYSCPELKTLGVDENIGFENIGQRAFLFSGVSGFVNTKTGETATIRMIGENPQIYLEAFATGIQSPIYLKALTENATITIGENAFGSKVSSITFDGEKNAKYVLNRQAFTTNQGNFYIYITNNAYVKFNANSVWSSEKGHLYINDNMSSDNALNRFSCFVSGKDITAFRNFSAVKVGSDYKVLTYSILKNKHNQ